MSTNPNNLNPSHRNPITLCLCLALLCCAGYYTTQSYLDYKRSEHLKVNGIPYRTPTKMTLSMLTEDPRNPKNGMVVSSDVNTSYGACTEMQNRHPNRTDKTDMMVLCVPEKTIDTNRE